MAVDRIGKVTEVQSTPTSDLQEVQLRRRLAFDPNSTFESGTSTDLSGLTSPLDDATQAEYSALFAGLSPAQQANIHTSSLALGTALLQAGPSAGTSTAVHTAALSTYDCITAAGTSSVVNSTQTFMAAAMSGVDASLTQFAMRVNDLNNLAKDLRTQYTELADMIKDWPDDGSKKTFSWDEATFDDKGNPTIVHHTNEPLTKEQAQNLLQHIDDMKSNASDIGATASFDLQQMSQNASEIQTMITDLLAQIHQSAQNIVSNMKW